MLLDSSKKNAQLDIIKLNFLILALTFIGYCYTVIIIILNNNPKQLKTDYGLR